MHYKYYLFSRGAKYFNPYAKRAMSYSHSKRGGSIATDDYLLSLLGDMTIKKNYKKKDYRGGAMPKRRTGGSKTLYFTR